MYFKKECLQKWGITEEEENQMILEIKVSGYRLNYDEKADLFYFKMEFGLKENEFEEQLLAYRKMEKEFKEEGRKIQIFEKRLAKLNNSPYKEFEGYVHGIGMYDYECIMEGINYMGAKNYADYWFKTRF